MSAGPPPESDGTVVGAAVGGRRPAPAGARPAVTGAWIASALISALPAIAFIEIIGTIPAWLWIAQVSVAVLLFAATFVLRGLKPLRRFAVVMAAFLLLLQALPLTDLTWQPLQALFGATAFDERMQSEQTGKLVVTLAMIGLLYVLGYRRRDFFLAAGNLTAPIRPAPVLGFPGADSWRRFGLIWGFGIAGALTVVQYAIARPTASDLAAIVPMLPAILFYAALNAFNEEMTYRAPMLATLEPAVGSTQAIWLSASLFGVAHYFGTPGGLLGAVLSVFMGWILSKAMAETRGLFWAWWIHFLSDVVIFAFIALTLVG